VLDDLDLVDGNLLADLETGETAEPAEYGSQSNGSGSKYALSETSITIGVKEKYTKLTVTMNASNDETPKITWRSGNKKIAKVNSKTGKITGVKKGKTTIYAKVEGYKKEIKCKVNVLKSPKARNFSISPKNGSLKVGQIGQYKIDFDHGYGGSFIFSSSDPEIASIDEKGLVTAIAPGTCKIKATMYNDVSHTVSLQVLDSGSSENETIDKLLEYARGKLGCPYDSKHNFGPNSFDCIGFTYWCYKQVGVKLKDSTSKQANDSRFMEVSYSELAPGDLVYFHTDSDPDVSHASIYLGDGEIIHASYSAGEVIISKLVSSKSDYYKRNFHCARRVFT
jgi:cell wall-associated NlpC family hydrolase